MMLFILFLIVPNLIAHDELLSQTRSEYGNYSTSKEKRYIIYDVNHGEGFNLRRDVYIRIANAIKGLREKGENVFLVLPPFGGLYHWRNQASKVEWGAFFDVQSMNRQIPVMEFGQFLEENPSQTIDRVVYLQNFAEGWGGEYVMKWEKRECIDGQKYYKKESDKWNGWFFSYSNVKAWNFECVSLQGDGETLQKMILKDYANDRILFIDRMEIILHDHYGDELFWATRRSMRYSNQLVEIGNKFRKEYLDSDDNSDGTILPQQWEKRKEDISKGGSFLCTHWRRRDFVRAHGNDLPSIEGTAKQLNDLVTQFTLKKVFLATDAPIEEILRLKKMVTVPMETFNDENLLDGQVAIVDQWICSHARYFIGSYVSTFSYRIQEDREILNFPPETTFNRLCPDTNQNCEQPAKWRIKYEGDDLFS